MLIFLLSKVLDLLKGAIHGNAKGAESSSPLSRFLFYCSAPAFHWANAPLKTPASSSGLLYFTFA